MRFPIIGNFGLDIGSPKKSRRSRSRGCPRLEQLEDRVTPVGQLFEIDIPNAHATTQTTHDWDQVFADSQSGGNTSGALDSIFRHDTANVFFGGQTADNTDLPDWRYDPVENATSSQNILDAFAAAYVENGEVM